MMLEIKHIGTYQVSAGIIHGYIEINRAYNYLLLA